jgi:riboflavin kinase
VKAVTQDLPVLLELARAGAHVVPRKFTTGELAERLDISQPTAARKLAALQERGLITRELGSRGQNIRLTYTGLATLRSIHKELDMILGKKPIALELVGKVVSGVGEGRYYVGQKGYRQQFKRELGFEPYPGTFDVKLDKASLELRATLMELPGKQIGGFSIPKRTFGPVKCFPAMLNGTKVALVLPSRSHYSDVIELIAPKNLRRTLKLTDGDTVRVEVMI